MPEDTYLTRDEFLAYKKAAEKELEVLQLRNRNIEHRARRVKYEITAGVAAIGFSSLLFMTVPSRYNFAEAEVLEKIAVFGMFLGIGVAAASFIYFSYVATNQIDGNSQKMGDLEKELENAKAQPAYRSLTAMTHE